MVCVYCEQKTGVTNSRLQKKQNSVWRRRQCQTCNAVFTTVEAIDLGTSLIVMDDQKHSEAFSRDKLLLSLYDSLKHRKTAVQDATALTSTVIGSVLHGNSKAVISKVWLTDRVTYILERFDAVAAVHYVAYYK